jgi:hypothetical protein
MLSKQILGAGSMLDGILIAAAVALGWPTWIIYLGAGLAVIWGILILMGKK